MKLGHGLRALRRPSFYWYREQALIQSQLLFWEVDTQATRTLTVGLHRSD
jgi:hypothetical protein